MALYLPILMLVAYSFNAGKSVGIWEGVSLQWYVKAWGNEDVKAFKGQTLISSFARHANWITGSETFMPADMKDVPEVVIPEEFKDKGLFLATCSPRDQDYITAIRTALQK